jgi:antitoxin HigA-1
MTNPTRRRPTHPGIILEEDFVKSYGLTHIALARRLKVSFKTVSALCNGRQSVSADMALRLARLLRTTPEVWMNLQAAYDLWQADHNSASPAKSIAPLRMASGRRRPAPVRAKAL